MYCAQRNDTLLMLEQSKSWRKNSAHRGASLQARAKTQGQKDLQCLSKALLQAGTGRQVNEYPLVRVIVSSGNAWSTICCLLLNWEQTKGWSLRRWHAGRKLQPWIGKFHSTHSSKPENKSLNPWVKSLNRKFSQLTAQLDNQMLKTCTPHT